MDNKNNILLIVIIILVIALIAAGAYIIASNTSNVSVTDNITAGDETNNTDRSVTMSDNDSNVENSTDAEKDANTSDETYRVYNPQSDSYVTVVGEAYDDEVDRWYTYDADGVRYYNTRINND